MFRLAEREQQAKEAILARIVEDYQRQHPQWRGEPAVGKATLEVVFCCWQNLVLIGAIILLSELLLIIFRPIPIVALTTFLVGSIIEIIFLYLGCQDDKRLAKGMGHVCASRVVFDLEHIRDKKLKVQLYKALEYWTFINHMLSQQPNSLLRNHLVDTTQETTRWLQMVYHLAERVDKFRSNRIIQRDWQSLPVNIKNYEHKLSQEMNSDLRRQLEQTIYDQQRQWQNLQKLQDCMVKASCQLDSTVASLGTIYSQLLLVTNTGLQSARIKRLQTNIAEQVQRLEDLTTVIDEVYRP